MTKFHCDKLCGCGTCAPTRWALSYEEGFDKPLGSYTAGLFRESAAYTAAWFASRDPAKLAELMASALRARGFDVHTHRFLAECPDGSDSCDADVLIWQAEHDGTMALDIGLGDDNASRDMDATTFRAALLTITQTPPDESSRETCKRIIRGDH